MRNKNRINFLPNSLENIIMSAYNHIFKNIYNIIYRSVIKISPFYELINQDIEI